MNYWTEEDDAAVSRFHYAQGYMARIVEELPFARIDEVWPKALAAAAAAFPMPLSPDEKALFAQLDDIKMEI